MAEESKQEKFRINLWLLSKGMNNEHEKRDGRIF